MPDSFKRRLMKQLLSATISIVVVAVIIIVLNFDINKRMRRIEARRDETIIRSQSMLIFSDLQKEALQARSDYALLEAALPNRDQLIGFPRELEKRAKEHAIDLGFSFGNETPSVVGQPGSIRFTMSLGGEFDNILAFMKAFEAHPYFTSLSSVDLVRAENARYTLGTSGEIFTR